MRYCGVFRCGWWRLRRIIFIVVAVLEVVWWLEWSHDFWNVLLLPTSTTCVACPWEFSPSSSAATSSTSVSSSSSASPLKTIVVLGISSPFWFEFSERQRRHLIRNTWLLNPNTKEEEEDTSTTTPSATHRVCSLRDYFGKPNDDEGNQHQHSARNPFQPPVGSHFTPPCRLIYTFLLGRPESEDPALATTTTNRTTLFSTTMNRGDLYSSEQINHHENDVLFFNVNETDGIGKRWGWFRYYVQTILPLIKVKMNRNHPNHSRDENVLVGFTDSFVLLKPTLFWNHPLFDTIDNHDSTNPTNNDSHQTSSPPPTSRDYVYAGLPVNQTSIECTPQFKCASLQHPTMMRRFVLLSSPLVEDYLVNLQHQELSSSSRHFPELPHPGTYPDVAIANALPLFIGHNNKNENIAATHTTHHDHGDTAKTTRIRLVSLQGTMIATIPKKSGGSVGDYLQLYDRSKDKFANYVDATEEQLVRLHYPEMNETTTTSTTHEATATISTPRPPRLLLGIFTMDSPIERERRDMIRTTYLRAFVGTGTPNRICSISQLQLLKNKEPQVNIDNTMSTLSCQLVYAFVVGGNTDPNGPTEWISQDDTSRTKTTATEETVLARSPKHLPDHGKGDIVYLNIRENGKEGKSQSFFHYALSARRTLNTSYYFDYLAKTDSDTLLFPEILLDHLLPRLPFFPHNMRTYVGEYRIKPSTPTLNLGPAYMGGHFYMMSPDLARYITSPACNRSSLAVYSEDQSMGNFIHSLGEPIRRILIRDKVLQHPVKRVDRIGTLWKKYRKGKNG